MLRRFVPLLRLVAFSTTRAATAPSTTKTKLKAPVPAKDDKPTFGLTSNKNYITSNAVEAILSKPGKVPQEPFQWTTRPGYGEVPVYLRKNKATIQREKDYFEQYVKMHSAPVSVPAGHPHGRMGVRSHSDGE